MHTFEVSRRGGIMRRVLLALCASAAFGVAVTASGCGDYPVSPENGGSKGNEVRTTARTGQPVSGSASQMAQSTGAPGAMPITTPRIDAGTNVDATIDQ
jgi:hypothetical protein